MFSVKEIVKKNLEYYHSQKKFDGKQILVNADDSISVYIINWLETHQYPIQGLFSLNKDHIGLSLMGHKIQNMEQLLIPYNPQKIVLLSEYFDIEFNMRMDVLGYHDYIQRFVLSIPNYNKTSCHMIRKIADRCRNNHVASGVKRLLHGTYMYRKIKRQINKKDTIFLFPHKSLGDIFILCQYMRQKASLFDRNFVLVVVGDGCKKVAMQGEFKHVISIGDSDMYDLVATHEVCGGLKQVCILHYQYYFTEITSSLLVKNKINFFDSYRYLVFSEPLKKIQSLPEKSTDAEQLCKSLNILSGRTVLLAPYAKSIPEITPVLWEYLAYRLVEQGYDVVTNCGNDMELPIKNTRAICFPLELANAVVEYAGYFIGIRSGLCDIIAASKSKKIILYPQAEDGNSSIFDYYSLSSYSNIDYLKEYECSSHTLMADVQLILDGMNEF